MWAFNFGMNTGRSCWTNDVSDWSFKRIRPPGLSGGSGDGQRTNRSSQAKNMPWTWRTEMVVKGETDWNILEYLKDTTKWAPASCRLITSLIRVLTPAAYLKGHLYGYWIPVKVETSFWSTQRAFQFCSGNSMMAVDSGCKWQTKKVAMSARCHKSHVTWFRVGFPLSWWEKGSVNHTIFHPNFWKKRWTFVQGAQQQQTTTAQGQDGLPWTCQAKRRCHRDVGEGLSSHHFFDIAIIESNLNIYVLDAKLFDFFSVKKTRFFFRLLSLLPIETPVESANGSMWSTCYFNVTSTSRPGSVGIRTNKAQGNRMEKKMGTRLALCFEDKITSLNLIQDFLHADMNFKIQKRFLKLPFAPKVGGLYLLHHFHSISTRPPKLDSLKGWPSNRNRRCLGCLWRGRLSLGLFFSKSMEP